MLKAIVLTMLVVSIGYVYSVNDPFPNCGKRLVPGLDKRIVGGNVSVQGSWPWQVAMLFNGNRQFCGGTLINDQWIVSAAHCFILSWPDYRKKRLVDLKYVTAALGEHKLGTVEGFEQIKTIAKIIIHPLHETFYDYDIALVKLTTPVTLDQYVYPSCLLRPNQTFPTGEECYVTGWGDTKSAPGNEPEVLMQVKVELVDTEVCEERHTGQIHGRVLCAGFEEGGKDSCRGDSGGPLVCQKDGVFYLTGVVSWGNIICAKPHMYSVYTNMMAMTTWVQETIAADTK